jgi:KilA domain-containing protein
MASWIHSFADSAGSPLELYVREDSFFNATRMCRLGKKHWKNYHANQTTKNFLDELRSCNEAGKRALIELGAGKRSTWVCPEIAIHLALWISPRFAVEVVKILANLGNQQLAHTGKSDIMETMLNAIADEGLRPRQSHGIIYAVTSPYYAAVKLGYWTEDLKSLIKRYKTLLTSELQVITRFVDNAPLAEREMHSAFAHRKIDGEVFEKRGWEAYVSYIQKL